MRTNSDPQLFPKAVIKGHGFKYGRMPRFSYVKNDISKGGGEAITSETVISRYVKFGSADIMTTTGLSYCKNCWSVDSEPIF